MGSALEVAILIVLFGWLSLVAAVLFLAVRVMRRGLKTGRRWLQRVGLSGGAHGPDPGAVRAVAAATVASPGWWVAQHDRQRMWRAVSSADHAVGVARRAGAPVGDMPMLVRQLRTAARGVDAVVQASARDKSRRREARAEQARIVSAATDLQEAALHSLRTVAGTDVDDLMWAARVEAEALAEGLRATRAVSGPGAA